MVLKFYNTLTRKKETFKPIRAGIVHIYNCGPTLYDYAHIGNFRSYIMADLLRRYLEYLGYRVTQIMNVTDVDDKTIKGSKKEKLPLKEFTRKYEKAFFEDKKVLGIKDATKYTRATEHIREMVALVKSLLKKGYAYEGDDGSVYYNIRKFRGYGKLSGVELSGLKAGARVSHDEYTKEEVSDFVLWKAWSRGDGKVFWETGIGKGRPGWHIECSAMSMKHLGSHFDMHTGGVDLIFPHHENEIAQSEAATGRKFVNYWVHNEHLLVDGKKMSKSLGNFYTLRDLLKKGFDPVAIRYILLATHHRQQLNFTLRGMEAAEAAVKRLSDFLDSLKAADGKESRNIDALADKARRGFEKAMNDDLNVPLALAAIFDMVRDVNKALGKGLVGRKNARKIRGVLMTFNSVLGVIKTERAEVDMKKLAALLLKLTGKPVKGSMSRLVETAIKVRQEAREKKDFRKADKIRAELAKLGIVLEDQNGDTKWKLAR